MELLAQQGSVQVGLCTRAAGAPSNVKLTAYQVSRLPNLQKEPRKSVQIALLPRSAVFFLVSPRA